MREAVGAAPNVVRIRIVALRGGRDKLERECSRATDRTGDSTFASRMAQGLCLGAHIISSESVREERENGLHVVGDDRGAVDFEERVGLAWASRLG
jgi:hypothetical protein